MVLKIFYILNLLILWYLIIFSAGYIALLLMSIRDVFLRFYEVKVGDVLALMKNKALPPVTVVMPVYNEEKMIIDSIKSILQSDYSKVQLIAVNDGSTDKTLQLIIDTFGMRKINGFVPDFIQNTGKIIGYYISDTYPNITVIDKEHRSRGDSLNVGINACRTPLMMTVDADSIIDPSAISELVFYMMTREHAVAVGGTVLVLNANEVKDGRVIKETFPTRYVPGVQAIEYLRSFLFNRAGWNHSSGALCHSGTATLLEHKALVDVGGYDPKNPSDDFEIILRLHSHKRESDIPYQIGFSPAAIVWTDVPATLKEYWHQRAMWQRGMIQSLGSHKYMLFNAKYGAVGFFNYPFYLLCETYGPVVEFTAYFLVILSWFLGIFTLYYVLLLFFVCLFFVTLLSVATVFMNIITYNKYAGLSDIPRVLLYVLTEPVGFRQYSVVCRTWATIKYLFTGK